MYVSVRMVGGMLDRDQVVDGRLMGGFLVCVLGGGGGSLSFSVSCTLDGGDGLRRETSKTLGKEHLTGSPLTSAKI